MISRQEMLDLEAKSSIPVSKLMDNAGKAIAETIKEASDIKDKRILNLRCQTGALSERLQSEGAKVFNVEPFEKNMQYARNQRKLSDIFPLPFSRFSQLQIPFQGPFDAINVLTHHVLAHVLSPHILLEKIFSLLKPGGYLFLDEKDVLWPARPRPWPGTPRHAA